MSSEARPTSVRAKSMEVACVGNDRYEFAARLTDRAVNGNFPGDSVIIHDFEARGLVQGDGLLLVELVVEAHEHPYDECPFVLPATDQLVGASVARGWRTTVLDLLGGRRGCTHVNTLLLGLSELTTMVIFQRMNPAVPYTPDARADGSWTREGLRVAPRLGNVCFGLRQEGRAIGRALGSDDPPLS
jgi:hypothetical protein